MMYRVLLVEDDPDDVLLMRLALENTSSSWCFDVVPVGTLSAAETMLETNRFDAIILDLGLPDGTGKELPERLLKLCPDTPVVVVTGMDDRKKENEILLMPNVQTFLRKEELRNFASLGRELGSRINVAINRHKARSDCIEWHKAKMAEVGLVL